MLAAQGSPSSPSSLVKFSLYHSAGRVIFTRLLAALGRVQRRLIMRFSGDGQLLISQVPDVVNRVSHIWVAASTEVFGFDELVMAPAGTTVTVEMQTRPLVSLLNATSAVECLSFELVHAGLMMISSTAGGMFSFAETSYQLPAAIIPEGVAASYFQEPLIPQPAISFHLPAPLNLSERLAKMVRHAKRVTLAANHRRRFLCTVLGDGIRTELANAEATVMPSSASVLDEHRLFEVELRAEEAAKVIACAAEAAQSAVMCAVIPEQCLVLSTRIPSPCGPDRPAGSLTLILGAYAPD
jgi:hypothetical protein